MTEPLISPIRHDQIPSAARVMAYAFANAPRYTFLLPDNTRRHAKLPWYWETTIRASIHSGGVVHVAHDAAGSAVLGVSYLESTGTAQAQRPHSAAVWPLGDARPSRRPGLAAS